ncbi:unnamed protein product [Toxocara canis]|uniref:Uncharacterized protein n=1 Tax=Toxocara canis TaxID=6265 RepID=A0A183U792_TOXCA|nr:unnamed protein product [Toxocara canis]
MIDPLGLMIGPMEGDEQGHGSVTCGHEHDICKVTVICMHEHDLCIQLHICLFSRREVS